MASFDLTLIEPVNLATAKTVEIDFVSGHSVGDIIEADGTVSGAITDNILGVLIRAGDANGKRSLVLVEGEVVTSAAHGLAANKVIYSDGDNTASDVEPSATGRITELGQTISTTRAYIKVTTYDSGGA